MEKLQEFFERYIKGFWPGVVGGAMFWGYVDFPLRTFTVKFPDWFINALGFIALTISTAVLKLLAEWWFDEYGKQAVTKTRNCIKFKLIKISRYVKRKKDKAA